MVTISSEESEAYKLAGIDENEMLDCVYGSMGIFMNRLKSLGYMEYIRLNYSEEMYNKFNTPEIFQEMLNFRLSHTTDPLSRVVGEKLFRLHIDYIMETVFNRSTFHKKTGGVAYWFLPIIKKPEMEEIKGKNPRLYELLMKAPVIVDPEYVAEMKALEQFSNLDLIKVIGLVHSMAISLAG